MMVKMSEEKKTELKRQVGSNYYLTYFYCL
jgi:hypothetical protein